MHASGVISLFLFFFFFLGRITSLHLVVEFSFSHESARSRPALTADYVSRTFGCHTLWREDSIQLGKFENFYEQVS